MDMYRNGHPNFIVASVIFAVRPKLIDLEVLEETTLVPAIPPVPLGFRGSPASSPIYARLCETLAQRVDLHLLQALLARCAAALLRYSCCPLLRLCTRLASTALRGIGCCAGALLIGFAVASCIPELRRSSARFWPAA